MRPINGKCAMTREERNRHRRLLDLNPFHHEMTLRTARRWRKRHQEELKVRRRERYATDTEYREREKKRQREWGERNKESKARAWKKWADRNREKLRARDFARYKTTKDEERRKMQASKRRERIRTDPQYAEKLRAQKRESWQMYGRKDR